MFACLHYSPMTKDATKALRAAHLYEKAMKALLDKFATPEAIEIAKAWMNTPQGDWNEKVGLGYRMDAIVKSSPEINFLYGRAQTAFFRSQMNLCESLGSDWYEDWSLPHFGTVIVMPYLASKETLNG